VSEAGRDLKAVILTLVPTGLGYIVGGWVLGVLCLAVAVAISLILWTPIGPWLGFQRPDGESAAPRSGQDSLRGELARRARDSRGPQVVEPGRTYGGAAVGAAVREHAARQDQQALFVAVEGEVGVLLEEAVELRKLLSDELPWITPKGTELEEAIRHWREKVDDFIAVVLGPGRRAAFRTVYTGNDPTDRLEAEAGFLADLGREVEAGAIRVDQDEFLQARERRRDNKAAGFLEYDHFRAPGAPAPVDLARRIDALMREGIELVAELQVPVEPTKTPHGGVEVSGGAAPEEWQDKVTAFKSKAWELLVERHPALLTTYRDACNATIQKGREARPESRPRQASRDERSGLEKALDLANFQRGGPAKEVEITLDGLAAARQRLAELEGHPESP